MANLYVVLNENNDVIEACPSQIQGGVLLTCTDQQLNEIMNLRFDATSDGVQITSTSEGADALMQAQRIEYENQIKNPTP